MYLIQEEKIVKMVEDLYTKKSPNMQLNIQNMY